MLSPYFDVTTGFIFFSFWNKKKMSTPTINISLFWKSRNRLIVETYITTFNCLSFLIYFILTLKIFLFCKKIFFWLILIPSLLQYINISYNKPNKSLCVLKIKLQIHFFATISKLMWTHWIIVYSMSRRKNVTLSRLSISL